MADSPTRLYDVCTALLATVNAGFAGEGVALPARQYVADGPPAYDCEQVVVALVRLFPGLPQQPDPNNPVMQATLLRSATLAVHVVRCVPVLDDRGRPPTAAAQDASGANVLTDAFVLPTCVVRAWHAGTFLGLCEGMRISELVPAEPSGGFGGSILTLDVQL